MPSLVGSGKKRGTLEVMVFVSSKKSLSVIKPCFLCPWGEEFLALPIKPPLSRCKIIFPPTFYNSLLLTIKLSVSQPKIIFLPIFYNSLILPIKLSSSQHNIIFPHFLQFSSFTY